MEKLIKFINELKTNLSKMGIGDKSKEYNKNLVEFIEFINIINVAELSTISALNRLESRGSHYRTDYPNTMNEYEKSSISINVYSKINNKLEDF